MSATNRAKPNASDEGSNLGREELMQHAVEFLQHPKVVRDATDDAKKAFLKKQGLTEDEIAAAFATVRLRENRSLTAGPTATRPSFFRDVVGKSLLALSVIGGVAMSAGPFLQRCYTEMKDIFVSIQEDVQVQRAVLEHLAESCSADFFTIKSDLADVRHRQEQQKEEVFAVRQEIDGIRKMLETQKDSGNKHLQEEEPDLLTLERACSPISSLDDQPGVEDQTAASSARPSAAQQVVASSSAANGTLLDQVQSQDALQPNRSYPMATETEQRSEQESERGGTGNVKESAFEPTYPGGGIVMYRIPDE